MNVDDLLHMLKGRISEANLYRFCQMLEQAMPDHPPLGSTADPSDDPVRFRPDPGMGFPAGEFKAIETDDAHPRRPATVRTRMLGLYGVDSPLPTSFLDDITQRREGHEALEAFLDIFNHRILTQFYRIWRKYSYPASFAPAGRDSTSQCLLGLIGLGTQGAVKRVETPVSRFLALLSVMRMPSRNADGIGALVSLLAPGTKTKVTPHWPRKVVIDHPASLCPKNPIRLSQGVPLGNVGRDVNSQVLITLTVRGPEDVQPWLPGGHLHTDLLVLLRVYLGWRYTAKLEMLVPVSYLPEPRLGSPLVRLGQTAMFGAGPNAAHDTRIITIDLGRFEGLQPNGKRRECEHVADLF